MSRCTRPVLWACVVAVAVVACDSGTGVDPLPPPERDVALAVGANHACGLDVEGMAYCWGGNSEGQLGAGNLTGRHQPVPVVDGHRFMAISASGSTTCALTADEGAAYCWGHNSHGQVGDGTTQNRTQPHRVGGNEVFEEIAVGFRFVCARTAEGHVYCWGVNDRAQTGNPHSGAVPEPRRVGGTLTFTSLTVGLLQACALTAGGEAYCWGGGQFGALGTGDTNDRAQPTAVSGGLTFSRIATGASTTCGVTTSGQTYCWGLDHHGSLGTGEVHGQPQRLVPARVAGDPGLVRVQPGAENSVFAPACGLTSTGAAHCWGSDAYGTLASSATTQQCSISTGSFPCTGTPLAVEGGFRFSVIRPAGEFVCGITTDGRLYCWGNNHLGQLGSTAATQTCSPTGETRPCSRVPLPVTPTFTVP